MTTHPEVRLYEDGAGRLVLWCPERDEGYDVTEIQCDGSFRADAAALARGDTSDWSVPRVEEEPDESATRDGCSLVAWTDGSALAVSSVRGPRRAASNYLGMER